MDELTELIIQNKNLIYSIAEKFHTYPNKDDLFQAGAIGFKKAYEKYDPSMNVKLTTYAYSYIFGEMYAFVSEDRSLKVGRSLSKLALKIEKTRILLCQNLEREPSTREIASYLEMDERLIVSALESTYKVQSMDEVIYSDGKDMVLSDFIEDKKEVDLDSLLMLKEELQKLTPFERSLIQKRYFSDFTQSETAKMLGIGQVQVSRKEQKILQKMKAGMLS